METQKYQEAIQAQNDVSSIEQLDYAEPAIEPISPKVATTTIFGFILSVILGFAIVILKSVRKNN